MAEASFDIVKQQEEVRLGDNDLEGDHNRSNNDEEEGFSGAEQLQRGRSGFKVRAGKHLAFIDKDGDGFISRDEVEEFILSHHTTETEKKIFKFGFFAMLVMMIFFSFAITGLTWGVIVLTKEVSVKDDMMVSSETGEALQCANTDIVVTNGILSARHSSTSDGSSTRRLQEDDDDVLDDDTILALGVRNVFKNRRLSSTMPDSYFKELQWFEIESPSGTFLTLKVLAIVRIPSSNALCGTYLKLGTIYGTIIIDDFDLYFDDATSDIFLQSGLFDYQTSLSLNRRKLSTISEPNMRKLSGDDFSIVGFFNAIDDKDWTCESVRKPSMPSVYSAEFTLLTSCETYDGSPDECEVSIPESTDPIPGYGIVTRDGIDYYTRTRRAFVTADTTSLVDTYPHMPGMTFVTQSFADGSMSHSYQFDVEGNLAQCQEYNHMDIRMTLPDDFLFYPLGDVDGSNLYRYRLSYMGVKGHASDGKEWIHVDYFEDNTTFLPKSLISDYNILQVDSMQTEADVEAFSSSGFEISREQFETCVIATTASRSDRVEYYSMGKTPITSANGSAVTESHLYQQELNSWDWENMPYPPDYAPLSAMPFSTLSYFVRYHANMTFDEEGELTDAVPLDDFGAWLVNIIMYEVDENIVDLPTPSNGTDFEGIFYVQNVTSNFSNSTDLLILINNANTSDVGRRHLTAPHTMMMVYDPAVTSSEQQQKRKMTSIHGRQLGLKFELDPLTPAIHIDIEKFSVDYEIAFANNKLHHDIGLNGQGCWAGVVCVSGSIGALIPHDGPSKSDFGGSVSFDLDVKAFILNILTLRYDYTPNPKSYASYTYEGGTHLAAAEKSMSVAEQVKGTMGVEVIHGKRRKKSGKTTLYNAGRVSLFVKTQYFKGVGLIGAGSWKTVFSFNVPVKSWGTSSVAALANCAASVTTDIPEWTPFPPNWSLSAGDAYINMASNGKLMIKINVDGKKEVLWQSNNDLSPSPEIYYFAWITSWDGSEASLVIFDNQAGDIVYDLTFDISAKRGCNNPISVHFDNVFFGDENAVICGDDEDEAVLSAADLEAHSSNSQGFTRLQLSGDGNLKLQYTVLEENTFVRRIKKKYGWLYFYDFETVSYGYKTVWKTAWEAGVHGVCDK